MSPYIPPGGKLYRQFFDIATQDIHAQIRFYESHERELSLLSVEQRFTLLCYYANALFAAEDYQRYLYYAPQVLETSIVEDIQYIDGCDVYLHTLHLKSLAHLRLKSFADAAQTASQLLAIEPQNKQYRRLFRQILLLQLPLFVRQAFAFALSSIILWTLFEIFRTLSFEPVYQKIDTQVQSMQRGLLLIALISTIIGLIGHYRAVRHNMNKASKKAYTK